MGTYRRTRRNLSQRGMAAVQILYNLRLLIIVGLSSISKHDFNWALHALHLSSITACMVASLVHCYLHIRRKQKLHGPSSGSEYEMSRCSKRWLLTLYTTAYNPFVSQLLHTSVLYILSSNPTTSDLLYYIRIVFERHHCFVDSIADQSANPETIITYSRWHFYNSTSISNAPSKR